MLCPGTTGPLESPQNRLARSDGSGGDDDPQAPEAFRKFLLADMAKWADVVKKSGAKAD